MGWTRLINAVSNVIKPLPPNWVQRIQPIASFLGSRGLMGTAGFEVAALGAGRDVGSACAGSFCTMGPLVGAGCFRVVGFLSSFAAMSAGSELGVALSLLGCAHVIQAKLKHSEMTTVTSMVFCRCIITPSFA